MRIMRRISKERLVKNETQQGMTVKMLLLEYLQEGKSGGFYVLFLSHPEYNENEVLFSKRPPSASHRSHSTRTTV